MHVPSRARDDVCSARLACAKPAAAPVVDRFKYAFLWWYAAVQSMCLVRVRAHIECIFFAALLVGECLPSVDAHTQSGEIPRTACIN